MRQLDRAFAQLEEFFAVTQACGRRFSPSPSTDKDNLGGIKDLTSAAAHQFYSLASARRRPCSRTWPCTADQYLASSDLKHAKMLARQLWSRLNLLSSAVIRHVTYIENHKCVS
jgi:hypothetical protein